MACICLLPPLNNGKIKTQVDVNPHNEDNGAKASRGSIESLENGQQVTQAEQATPRVCGGLRIQGGPLSHPGARHSGLAPTQEGAHRWASYHSPF